MDQTSQQIVAEMLNAEMDRFWARFNIFAAVQVGALVGILNILPLLSANRALFRLVFVFLIFFSAMGVIAVMRGHDLQYALVKTLGEVEQLLPEEHRLLSLAQKHSRLPTFIGNYAGLAFSIFCCLCWVVTWIWLEWSSYAGIEIATSPED